MLGRIISSSDEQKLVFAFGWKLKADNLGRDKAVECEMGADEIVEEKEKRDEVVGGIERSEPLLGLYQALNCLLKHSMRLFVCRRGSSGPGYV